LIKVVTVVSVFETPFKIAVAVAPPEGVLATAREATPAIRASITARPTTMDAVLVSRQNLRSETFIRFMIFLPLDQSRSLPGDDVPPRAWFAFWCAVYAPVLKSRSAKVLLLSLARHHVGTC
jgi:hypothetical protein